MTEVLVCDICQNTIEVDPTGWDGGHDAYPVTQGRCCTECNHQFVIPMRFLRIRHRKKITHDKYLEYKGFEIHRI